MMPDVDKETRQLLDQIKKDDDQEELRSLGEPHLWRMGEALWLIDLAESMNKKVTPLSHKDCRIRRLKNRLAVRDFIDRPHWVQ